VISFGLLEETLFRTVTPLSRKSFMNYLVEVVMNNFSEVNNVILVDLMFPVFLDFKSAIV
jgi:hypothetical protein